MSHCVHVLKEVRRRALARDAAAVATLAGRAVERALRALDLETHQAAGLPPETGDLEHLVDYAVDGIASYCNAQISVFRGEPRAAAAERVKRALLPGGVGSIADLSHADLHAQVEDLLARAEAPALAGDVAFLVELPVLLDRLRVLNQKYGAALHAVEGGPSDEEVRAERERCHALMAQTVDQILEHYALQPPERRADGDYLLEPLLGRNQAWNDEQPIESAA